MNSTDEKRDETALESHSLVAGALFLLRGWGAEGPSSKYHSAGNRLVKVHAWR